MGRITVRYRDIPFEEAVKCTTPAGKNERCNEKYWEANMRNQEVVIQVPAITSEQSLYVHCKGPFFAIIDKPLHVVCPHIAEIGD